VFLQNSVSATTLLRAVFLHGILMFGFGCEYGGVPCMLCVPFRLLLANEQVRLVKTVCCGHVPYFVNQLYILG
jgi:hypothetical protein